MTFTKGDKVRFTSKFGDVVTGVYMEEAVMPTGHGNILGHLVLASPFIPEDRMEVQCFIPEGNLEKVI